MDTEEEKRFIKGIKEAIAKSRGYADSFGWPPDRDLEEYGMEKFFKNLTVEEIYKNMEFLIEEMRKDKNISTIIKC